MIFIWFRTSVVDLRKSGNWETLCGGRAEIHEPREEGEVRKHCYTTAERISEGVVQIHFGEYF